MRADSAAHRLGVPEIGRARERDDGAHAKRRGGAHERSGVAGVLNRVEHEEACGSGAGDGERCQRAVGHVCDGENSLRMIGVGRREKILFAHLDTFNVALRDRIEQRDAARQLGNRGGA